MAFWALGKVKNLAGAVNIKQVGSKIKNYYTHQQKNQQSIISQKKTLPVLNEEQLMQRQIKAYKNLMKLEQQIIKEQEDKYQQKMKQAQQQLIKIQKQMQQQAKQIKKEQQMNKLIIEVQTGNKELKDIIKQNILLREEIQKKRINDNQIEL